MNNTEKRAIIHAVDLLRKAGYVVTPVCQCPLCQQARGPSPVPPKETLATPQCGATVVTEQPPVCVYCLKHGGDVLLCAAPGEPESVWAHVACAAAPICHSCNAKRADVGMTTCYFCRHGRAPK